LNLFLDYGVNGFFIDDPNVLYEILLNRTNINLEIWGLILFITFFSSCFFLIFIFSMFGYFKYSFSNKNYKNNHTHKNIDINLNNINDNSENNSSIN
jgi:hypothetical protein